MLSRRVTKTEVKSMLQLHIALDRCNKEEHDNRKIMWMVFITINEILFKFHWQHCCYTNDSTKACRIRVRPSTFLYGTQRMHWNWFKQDSTYPKHETRWCKCRSLIIQVEHFDSEQTCRLLRRFSTVSRCNSQTINGVILVIEWYTSTN